MQEVCRFSTVRQRRGAESCDGPVVFGDVAGRAPWIRAVGVVQCTVFGAAKAGLWRTVGSVPVPLFAPRPRSDSEKPSRPPAYGGIRPAGRNVLCASAPHSSTEHATPVVGEAEPVAPGPAVVVV